MSRTEITTTAASQTAVHVHCWWWNGFLKRTDVQCPDCARVASSIDVAKQSIEVYCAAQTGSSSSSGNATTTRRARASKVAHPPPSNVRASARACEANLMREMLHAKALRQMFDNHKTTRWLVSAALLAYDSLRQAIVSSNDPRENETGNSPIGQWTLLDVARIIYCSYHTPIAVARAIAKIEQRSPEWHLLRNGWCTPEHGIYRAMLNTSSVAAYLLKHKSGYSDPNRLVTEKLFAIKEVFNDLVQNMLDRGTASEPDIIFKFVTRLEQHLKRYRPQVQVSVQEVGIQIDLERPNNAASPDGILHIFDPETQVYWLSSLEMKCRGGENMAPYPSIPKHYYDQVQHTLNILKLPESFFVCQSASTLSVERFEYNKHTWESQMPIIEQYYWSVLFPAAVLNAHGYFEPSEALKIDARRMPPARIANRASEQYMSPLYATMLPASVSHMNAYREWWRGCVRDLLLNVMPRLTSQLVSRVLLGGDNAASLAMDVATQQPGGKHWWIPLLIHPKKRLQEIVISNATASHHEEVGQSLQQTHIEAVHMACRAVKNMLFHSSDPTPNARPLLNHHVLQVVRQFVEAPHDAKCAEALNRLADGGLKTFLARAERHITSVRSDAYAEQIKQYVERAQPWSWQDRFAPALLARNHTI